jgi:phosphoglycolate phosphatase-like HAD superfamily hydrolase
MNSSLSDTNDNPDISAPHSNGRFPRILLFDVDGTLINAVRRREYRGLVRDKLQQIFGTCGRLDQVDFAGKTDLAIYHEALQPEGFTIEMVQDKVPDLEAGMAEVLAGMAATGDVFEVCSGVRELLEALTTDDRFITSLLTGNLAKLAEAKLRLAGIWEYFRCCGAFGDDHPERDHLPAIAAARFSRQLGQELRPDRFVIIGDTPRDISCARYFGARVLSVASGRHTVEDLESLGPDAVLPSLTDTGQVIQLLERI